jgi:hypothetical protein
MFRGVELVLVIKQKIVTLPRAEPIVAKGVLVVIKVRYNEPKLNQHNGNIVRGVPRDWSIGIHNVNRVPRPNSPRCTYCHQIGHQINECPFIENNVKQRFAEHFQNLNPKPVRVKNHGHVEPEDLYHEKVKISDRFKEQI